MADQKGLEDLFYFFDLPEVLELCQKLEPGLVLQPAQIWQVVVGLAAQGWGWTSPNPPVGCVILNSRNKLIGWGFHRGLGRAHAEIEALAKVFNLEGLDLDDAGDWILPRDRTSLQGAKVFVSLEPCAFRGRTPSCAQTLAKLPLAEVWALEKDPHPKVNGQGLEILRKAGIKAELLSDSNSKNDDLGQLLTSIRKLGSFLLSGFFHRVAKARPMVVGKIAASVDGFYALDTGESQWITTGRSRDFARLLRGASDVVLTTSRTILKDDPLLDARGTPFAKKPRQLWIWDPHGHVLSSLCERLTKKQTPPRCFQLNQNESVLVFTDAPISFSRSLEVSLGTFSILPCSKLEEKISTFFGNSVWVESGGVFMSELLTKRWIDQLWLFTGAILLGGQQGLSWTKSLGIKTISEASRLHLLQARQLNDDLVQLFKFEA